MNMFDTRSIYFSVAIHVTMLITGIAASSISMTPKPLELDVVRVKLSAPPAPKKKKKPPPPPKKKKVEIPKPVVDEEPEISTDPPKKIEEKAELKNLKKEESQPIEETEDELVVDSIPDALSYAESSEVSPTFEDEGFDYPGWTYNGFKKIARAWRNQAYSTQPLICVINFRILKSGRVYGAKIQDGSGNPVFDRGCLQAVKKASPLPPLPSEYGHEEVGVSLVFPWKPR
ncbi:MAG: TonB family protein [candidate division Zixibacteria bacterium]|nr:TonB family protein [candidate division Zixibacteria bacterium]